MTHIYTFCVDMRDIYTQLDMTYIYTLRVGIAHTYTIYIAGCKIQCVAVCCSVLQCVAVCCSVLQCVAIYIAGCTIDTANLIRIRQCVYVRLEYIRFTQISQIRIHSTTHVAKDTMHFHQNLAVSARPNQSFIFSH